MRQNLQCLSCKSTNLLLLDPAVVLLVLVVVSFVLVMYESSSVISNKIELHVLLLWYERQYSQFYVAFFVHGISEISYAIGHENML